MAIYKRDIANINLETGNIHRTFLNHSIGYMDQKADHFGIRVFRNGEPVDLTGVSVQGVFMPPQGSPIAITGSTYTIVSGNTAEVILPQACYNYDGQFTLAIKLVDSTNSVTGTMRIVDGMVDNTHASGTVAPTSAVPTYQEILSTYDDMVAATAAANGAIAPLYANLTFPVKAGQYAIVDGALKRAIVDIATSEAYTAAHWTNAKLGPDLCDVKSALAFDEHLINEGQYTINKSDLESGGWVYSEKQENTTRARSKYLFPVRAGMVITYANTTFDTYFGVLATPTSLSYVQAIGWKTDGNGTINITEDGYMTFNIRNHSNQSATVNPADYNSTVVIKTVTGSDCDNFQSEITSINGAMGELIYQRVKNRQIFDVDTMLPSTPYMLVPNSSLVIGENSAWRLYPIEVNGVTGEMYTFNILANDDGDPQYFSDCGMWASNSLPVNGQSVLQDSVSSSAYMRGKITLAQNSKYIIIGIKCTLSSWPYDPFTAACNALMGHLVLRRNLDFGSTYYSYELEYVYKVVPYYQGSDFSGKILKVGNDGYIALADEPGGGGEVPDDAVGYYANQIVNVDSSILTSDITLGTGWSGNLSDGFIHTTGNTAELVFNATTENGEGYIIDFDVTGNTGDNLYATIGSEPYVDVYNGTSHVRIGIIADGGKLKIKPVSGYSGTITNIKLRKVIETGGTEITQVVYNIKDVGAEDNLTGFWNVAVGGMYTLQHNQNGSRNIAIGFMAVRDLKSGTRNICIGTYAMPFVTEGERNVCIGADTLYDTGTPGNRKALDNIAIGKAAMKSGSDVEKNVAIGTNAMGNSSGTATGNVGVGYGALYKCANNNVAIGMNANYFGTGGNNVAVGYGSGAKNTAPSSSNSIAIGYDTQFTKSNQMVLGNTSITEVVMCGNKKINFNNDGTVTWETIS